VYVSQFPYFRILCAKLLYIERCASLQYTGNIQHLNYHSLNPVSLPLYFTQKQNSQCLVAADTGLKASVETGGASFFIAFFFAFFFTAFTSLGAGTTGSAGILTTLTA
jgi:hypothetical protein